MEKFLFIFLTCHGTKGQSDYESNFNFKKIKKEDTWIKTEAGKRSKVDSKELTSLIHNYRDWARQKNESANMSNFIDYRKII